MESLSGPPFLGFQRSTSDKYVINIFISGVHIIYRCTTKNGVYFVCHLSYSPSLTWRDVQHVIVRSARPAPGGDPLDGAYWVKNKGGLVVSRFFGFGLMDAGKMVHLAKHWNRVPEQKKCEIKSQDQNRFAFCIFYSGPCCTGVRNPFHLY